jgi:osmotically-inducible protein OsmY
MFRLLFRLVVLVLVVGVVAYFALNYRWGTGESAPSPVATNGSGVNVERARRAGTEIAETVSEGASRAAKALDEGKLTTKIKSKMVLDDTIDASDVNVDTVGTVVTLRGSVASRKQHQRVLQLAQETAGVTSVVDKLTVREAP